MFSFARAAVAAIVALPATTQIGRAVVIAPQSGAQTEGAMAADTGTRRRTLDASFALATFDSAWRTVGTALEGRGVTRLDWGAVGREFRPRAAQAASDSALRVVIGEMLSRIGESHFAVMSGHGTSTADAPADGASLGTAGVALRFLDRRLVVWRADSGGPARRAGVAPGWVVEQIDNFEIPALGVTDTLPARRLPLLTDALRALRGAPGTSLRLVARDGAGVRHDITFTRDSIRGPFAKFGNLPPLPTSFVATRRTLSDGRCIEIIQFEYWLPPVMPALDRAVDASRGCAGIVLDLRGNLGGVAAMMMGISGHFLNEPRTLGTMRTRGEEMRFVANPRRSTMGGVPVEPYAGPLAIVVDGLSASTSEMFSAALQALSRARVFGERTPGQALPAMATRLPNGDVLMHVVADFVAADGSQIEGRGVMPDEVVPLTAVDLARERDGALEAAVRWISVPRPATP